MRKLSLCLAMVSVGCFSEPGGGDDATSAADGSESEDSGAATGSTTQSADEAGVTAAAATDDGGNPSGPDDTAADVPGGGPEVCNGIDDDLDGDLDEEGACPPGCVGVSVVDAVFYVCSDYRSRDVAAQGCADLDAELAVIDSAAQNLAVGVALGELVGTEAVTGWLAGNDRAQEATWAWDEDRIFWIGGPVPDGMAVDAAFTAWSPTEPNDLGEGEDCLGVNGLSVWFDLDCATMQPYVCRVP